MRLNLKNNYVPLMQQGGALYYFGPVARLEKK